VETCSEVEVDADPIPSSPLQIKLAVWGRPGIILSEELDLAVTDAGVLELDTCHNGMPDLPPGPLVTLKVCIGDRTEASAEKGPATDELYPPLSSGSP
jgi:hypothetical protein